MYAIVKTGGKQYKVAADDVIEVEKLAVEPENAVELEAVFIADGSTVITDADELNKAKVFATVLEQFRGDKQIIFKFKKRKGYKRLRGHRQDLTRLRIDAISLDGKAPEITKKTSEKKDEDAAEALADKTADEKVLASELEKSDETEVKTSGRKARAKKAEDNEGAEEESAKEKPSRRAAKKTEDSEEAEEKPKRRSSRKSAEDEEQDDKEAEEVSEAAEQEAEEAEAEEAEAETAEAEEVETEAVEAEEAEAEEKEEE